MTISGEGILLQPHYLNAISLFLSGGVRMSEPDVKIRMERLVGTINRLAAMMPTVQLREGMIAFGTDFGSVLGTMLERIEKLEGRSNK